MRNKSRLSCFLILLILCSQLLSVRALAGDELEITRKKYVRPPSADFFSRARRTQPVLAKSETPKSETAKPKQTQELTKNPVKPFNSDEDKEFNPTGQIITKTLDPTKGPEIRVALATDIGFAQITSKEPIAYFNSEQQQLVALSVNEIKVQMGAARERPGQIYRVQVASLKTNQEAERLVSQLRKQFTEPIFVNFDRDSEKYDVGVGDFYSSDQAKTFMVQLMNAGYKKTWVAKSEQSPSKYKEKFIKAVASGGSQVATASDRMILASQDDDAAPLLYNGKPYRGQIEVFTNKRGRLTIINRLAMEDYIRGVVPNELSPGGFPMLEALKAQAVAARTYAVRNMGQFNEEGYDLLATPLSQVYGGKGTEHPLTNKAVEETSGLVATYQGKPINALYTSTCGGTTESSEFVFSEAVPYLVSVACSSQGRSRRAEPSEKSEKSEKIDKKRNDNKDDVEENFNPRLFKTSRRLEPVVGENGRALTKEVANLAILNFSLPENLSSNSLQNLSTEKEISRWLAQLVEVKNQLPSDNVRNNSKDDSRDDFKTSSRGNSKDNSRDSYKSNSKDNSRDNSRDTSFKDNTKDITSISNFASALTQAVYGQDSPSRLLSAADADYLLGIDAKDIPLKHRTEVAALLQEGILSPYPDGSLHPRSPITRGAALLAISRALTKLGKPAMESGTTKPLEGRRVKIKTAKSKEPLEFEIASDCYLFRIINNEAFPTNNVEIVGGEKVNYHLDLKGRIDYLEIQPNPNGASSDRFSVFSRWQVEYSPEELKARLADARVNVGDILDLKVTQYGYSQRAAELKVIGTQGERTITGLRIRSALGLRESLFIIQRDYSTRGDVKSFRFAGRGWGHGVGMCQVGAYGLAVDGLNYEEILKTYYSGIDLTKVY